MDPTKLNDWMQVIGIFALVASLIFVGLQMKQTQEIALAAQYQSRAQTTVDFFLTRMESDLVSESYLERIGQDVNPSEIRHRHNVSQAQWTMMDNNHFQYQRGFLTDESWQGSVRLIRGMYGSCDGRWTFERRKRAMRTSFVEFVDSIGRGPCTDAPPMTIEPHEN